MATGIYTRFIIGAGLLTVLVGGCEGGDMATVMGIGDANPPIEETPRPRKPKPPTPPPPPPPKDEPSPPAAFLRRNLAFDSMRNRGIVLTRSKQLQPAVATFNTAARMKPGDKSVKMWLDAIRQAEAKGRGTGDAQPDAFANPQAGGMQPQPQFAPPAFAPPGAPPMVPPPGAVPAPTQVDPRLVF